jgi:transcription elongation factor Elf1
MTVATRKRVVQICRVKHNQRFTFTMPSCGDGTMTTVYIKIGNTMFCKADCQQACCLPITSLIYGIRTEVRPV